MFEVAVRTVHEDIRELRESMGLPIKWDKFKGGYINPDPKSKLPEFDLDEGEVFALTLGKDMLSQYSGTAFEPILASGIEKIAARLPERVKVDVADLNAAISFKSSGVANLSRRMFFELNKACEKKNVVTINYFTAHSGITTDRDIEPYRLVESRGAWYVVGWCRMREEIRIFALHRIRSYDVHYDQPFEPRNGVDIDAYLSSSFQLEHGDPEQRCIIKFDVVAARYVRERKWHDSEELTEHDDQSCTLSFNATRLEEVKRWVLLYGASAEVLEPPALREMLREEFESGNRIYSGSVTDMPARPLRVAARTAAKPGNKIATKVDAMKRPSDRK